jgi:outer membrane protein assembly factor BamD
MGFSPYIEKSRWRICESLTLLSPNYYHDQESSLKALSQIQEFIDDFPSSEFSKDAGLLLSSLRERLARKDMETGKLYVKLKAYDSAILSYENVINQYYDTVFFKNANLEIIRCYMLLGQKDNARTFFLNLEKSDKSVLTDSFKEEALNIIGLSS